MDILDQLCQAMIQYYSGDPKRIQHFLKVHSLSRQIAVMEGLDARTQTILEAAALVHDIGIKPAEARYGSCEGHLQEQEGPAAARPMLKALGFDSQAIDRICYLVGHHHTYSSMDGLDYHILVEADFLVNLYEDQSSMQSVQHALDRIFFTQSGKEICRTMFGIR